MLGQVDLIVSCKQQISEVKAAKITTGVKALLLFQKNTQVKVESGHKYFYLNKSIIVVFSVIFLTSGSQTT